MERKKFTYKDFQEIKQKLDNAAIWKNGQFENRQNFKDWLLHWGRPVMISVEDLMPLFGIVRVDGAGLLLKQITMPSLTEKQASQRMPLEVKREIEVWCRENNIFYEYFHQTNKYLLTPKSQL